MSRLIYFRPRRRHARHLAGAVATVASYCPPLSLHLVVRPLNAYANGDGPAGTRRAARSLVFLLVGDALTRRVWRQHDAEGAL